MIVNVCCNCGTVEPAGDDPESTFRLVRLLVSPATLNVRGSVPEGGEELEDALCPDCVKRIKSFLEGRGFGKLAAKVAKGSERGPRALRPAVES